MQKIEIAGHKLKLKTKTWRTGSKGYKASGTIRFKKHYYHVFLTLVARNSVPVQPTKEQPNTVDVVDVNSPLF